MWALLYLPNNAIVPKAKYTGPYDVDNRLVSFRRDTTFFYSKKECEKFRRALLVWTHFFVVNYRKHATALDNEVGCCLADTCYLPKRRDLPSFIRKRNRSKTYSLTYAAANHAFKVMEFNCLNCFCPEELLVIKV